MNRQISSNATTQKSRAFTLIQILVVLAIIALLAGISFGYLQRSRREAHRVACDTHLKAIALALDAFRQEHGSYPHSLSELTADHYITDLSLMRCPLDPRPNGSYDDYYIFRGTRAATGDTRDQSALPMVVCPFHEDNGHGAQAFHGGTKQYSTMTATLVNSTGATVERPGKSAMSGRNGMTLYGGDLVRTEDGSARILFADGSYADLQPKSEVTVLQSFIAGQQNAPLYTIIRQHLGEISYRVNPGSKFDVVTPSATAGALGTKFDIKCDGDSWYLRVRESRVLCDTATGSSVYTPSTRTLNGGSGSDWNYIGRGSDSSSDSSGDDHGGHGSDG